MPLLSLAAAALHPVSMVGHSVTTITTLVHEFLATLTLLPVHAGSKP
jgi:hypothetical protein